jgi:hypothetical protein
VTPLRGKVSLGVLVAGYVAIAVDAGARDRAAGVCVVAPFRKRVRVLELLA